MAFRDGQHQGLLKQHFGFEGLVQLFFLVNGGLVLGAVLLTDDRPVDPKLSLN